MMLFVVACLGSEAMAKGIYFNEMNPSPHSPTSSLPIGSGSVPHDSRNAAPKAVIINGQSCNVVTFEGAGNLIPIPRFLGISSPGWLGSIEQAAGGTGNFRNEPSPITTAFWLGGPASRNIVFNTPASQVSFSYSSFVPVTITAFDAAGNALAAAVGPANFDFATGVYDIWNQLQVNVPTASIAFVTVSGNVNQTGIDNLTVCQPLSIGSVEFTQAIQQYQTLADFKTSLKNTGEPPVPIIANKPAVLRVYLNPLQAATNVTVKLSGVSNQTIRVPMQPNCRLGDQRSGAKGCRSPNFYFKPPTGQWKATVDLLDPNGVVLQEEVFNMKSRVTSALRMRSVSVCDSTITIPLINFSIWQCGDVSGFTDRMKVLKRIAPTASLTVDASGIVVRDKVSDYANPVNWWFSVTRKIESNFDLFSALTDLLAGRQTYYLGQVRPDVPGGIGGMAANIPGHGAASRTSAIRLGVETVNETAAHETGHMLGLRHTNTNVPDATMANVPPGCYNLAVDPGTDWTFANNLIQSTAGLEVGFDVAGRKSVDPNSNYEIMSYCTPRWISPLRYKSMITALSGGPVTSPSITPLGLAGSNWTQSPSMTPTANYWQVRGEIDTGGIAWSSLFTFQLQNIAPVPAGPYSLNVLDANNVVLSSIPFTPDVAETETTGPDEVANPYFSLLVPVVSNAAFIVVVGPTGAELGRLNLGGLPPAIGFDLAHSVFGPSGIQDIIWTVNTPLSTFTALLLYSPDGGTSWTEVGEQNNATAMSVDFDSLPGSSNALMQLLVSDGINTATVTSPVFSVNRKAPSVTIFGPDPGLAQPASDPVFLDGTAVDPEDGTLPDSSLQWSSSLQGTLGTGAQLTTSLQPGSHTITLTATDSNGNTATASTNVLIGGSGPTLTLQSTEVDQNPTTCQLITISALPGTNGAPLSSVQYSLDGGNTFTNIPLANLPYTFPAPGYGFTQLVARATDLSGQTDVKDTDFFTQSACSSGEPLIQGTVASQGLQSPGLYVVSVTLTNIGTGDARQIAIKPSAQRLAGSGTISYSGPSSLAVPNLGPNQSATVQLQFTVPNPNTVTRFKVSEAGTMLDIAGNPLTFIASQIVIP